MNTSSSFSPSGLTSKRSPIRINTQSSLQQICGPVPLHRPTRRVMMLHKCLDRNFSLKGVHLKPIPLSKSHKLLKSMVKLPSLNFNFKLKPTQSYSEKVAVKLPRRKIKPWNYENHFHCPRMTLKAKHDLAQTRILARSASFTAQSRKMRSRFIQFNQTNNFATFDQNISMELIDRPKESLEPPLIDLLPHPAPKPQTAIRFRKMLSAIKQLLSLDLKDNEIDSLSDLMPSRPFQAVNSRDFLDACKDGNVQLLTSLLEEDKWIAHSFDCFGQNGLHVAVKNCQLEILNVMLTKGTYIDAKDYAGRTPLLLAAKTGFVGGVRALLSHKSDPCTKTYAGVSAIDASNNELIKKLISKSRLVFDT